MAQVIIQPFSTQPPNGSRGGGIHAIKGSHCQLLFAIEVEFVCRS
jgi:hypothetical protein